MLFSFYEAPVSNVRPARQITPREVAKYLLSPYSYERTAQVRAATTAEQRREIKRRILDFVTIGGTFRKRALSGLTSLSGLMILDFDHCTDCDAVKRWAIFSLPCWAVWRSPSGEGVKVLIDLSADWIANGFTLDVPFDSHGTRERAAAFYKERYCQFMSMAKLAFGDDCGADDSASDITRATYLSCDLDTWINPRTLL